MSVQRLQAPENVDKFAIEVDFTDGNGPANDRAGDDYEMQRMYEDSLTCPVQRVMPDNSPVDKLPSA